MVSEVLHCTLI